MSELLGICKIRWPHAWWFIYLLIWTSPWISTKQCSSFSYSAVSIRQVRLELCTFHAQCFLMRMSLLSLSACPFHSARTSRPIPWYHLCYFHQAVREHYLVYIITTCFSTWRSVWPATFWGVTEKLKKLCKTAKGLAATFSDEEIQKLVPLRDMWLHWHDYVEK